VYVKLQISRDAAAHVNQDFLSLDAGLNAYLREAQLALPEKEFYQLRRAVGDVLGILFADVMKNIYAAHPDLRLPGMP